MSSHNIFSLRNKNNIYLIIWILFLARIVLFQVKATETSYLPSRKWNKDELGKHVVHCVFPQLCIYLKY